MGDTRPQDAVGDRRPRRAGPRVRVATRAPADHSRTSPWMRLDLLQLVSWLAGLTVIVSGLLAFARIGFTDLELFEPVVEVAGLPATPLLALLLVLFGTMLLVAATGEVDDRSLRIIGVLVGIVAAVWIVEPGAFTPYLGVERDNGIAALVLGVALSVASFVPPLEIRRPGVSASTPW